MDVHLYVCFSLSCMYVPPPLNVLIKLITGPHDSVLPPQLPKTGTIVKDSLRGVFKTREELDGYEKMWHCCVYQPTWNELKNKVL